MEILSGIVLIGMIMVVAMIAKMKKSSTHNFRVINKKVNEIGYKLDQIKSGEFISVKESSKSSGELKVDGQKLTTSVNPVPPKQQGEIVLSSSIKEGHISKTEMDALESVLEESISKTESKPALIRPLKASSELQMEKVSTKTKVQKTKEFEKIIGENWLNKIGIAVLVIGIGFFVKYAIDQNWIGEVGRVMIGISTGATLLGIAHFMRKKYASFSSVLIGGGISTIYYTLTIAYQYYGLFPQSIGFLLILLNTILAVILAVLYNRKELAVIALLGAYTAPFMVSGNTPNYTAFLTYLAIVNAGMLALSFVKNWKILNYLAFGFTYLFFGAWVAMGSLMDSSVLVTNNRIALTFSIIYFTQFTGMILSYNAVRKIKFKALDMIHLISISGLFFGITVLILETFEGKNLNGILAIGLGVFFTTLIFAFRKLADEKLIQTLKGKLVLFSTLSFLLIFEGNYTAIFWAAEAVLLIWLGHKTKDSIFRKGGIVVQILAIGALVIDWGRTYFLGEGVEFYGLNTTFISGFLVLVGLFFSKKLIAKQEKEHPSLSQILMAYNCTLAALTYAVGFLEVIALGKMITTSGGYDLTIWAYNALYFLGLMVIIGVQKNSRMREIVFFASSIFVIAFTVFGEFNISSIRDSAVESLSVKSLFQLHYILVATVLGIVLAIFKMSKHVVESNEGQHVLRCIVSVVLLVLLCQEIDHASVMLYANSRADINSILQNVHVAVYTVVWAIYALVLMVLGLKKNIRMLRIFALGAFSLTILKLFTYDISNISTGGKIVAFISLGIILLVVSFLYQKLKRLIVEGKMEE